MAYLFYQHTKTTMRSSNGSSDYFFVGSKDGDGCVALEYSTYMAGGGNTQWYFTARSANESGVGTYGVSYGDSGEGGMVCNEMGHHKNFVIDPCACFEDVIFRFVHQKERILESWSML